MRFAPCNLLSDIGSDTLAQVGSGLLPLLVFPDVPILRRIDHQMQILDRFVLEVCLRLGSISATDILEATGVPHAVADTVCHRLAAHGLLRETEDQDTVYVADAMLAERALAEDCFHEDKEDTCDFILLTRTGDLMPVGGDDAWLTLNRIVPYSKAPVLRELSGKPINDLVAECVRQANLQQTDGIVDAVAGEESCPVEDLAPAYRFAGTLREDGNRRRFSVQLVSARRDRRGASGPRALRVHLDRATGLIEQLCEAVVSCRAKWADGAAIVLGVDRSALDETDITEEGPACWRIRLDGPSTRHVLNGMELTDRAGLQVELDSGITLEFSLGVEPKDDEARRYFVLDHITGVLSENTTTTQADVVEAAEQACCRYEYARDALESEAILDWLWRRGAYAVVYDLRKEEDFSYA